MHVGTFIHPKKSTWQKLHSYEQELGYIRGLPEKSNFSSIFTKNQRSCLMGEMVMPYNVFQTLGFKTSMLFLLLEIFFIGPIR